MGPELTVSRAGGELSLSAPTRRRLERRLAALAVLASVWVLVAVRLDQNAALAPPGGPVPWLGAEDALPRLR